MVVVVVAEVVVVVSVVVVVVVAEVVVVVPVVVVAEVVVVSAFFSIWIPPSMICKATRCKSSLIVDFSRSIPEMPVNPSAASSETSKCRIANVPLSVIFLVAASSQIMTYGTAFRSFPNVVMASANASPFSICFNRRISES